MSLGAETTSIGQGLAAVAALVGLGCLLLGRRSVSRALLTSMTVLVALSGALAMAQLVELEPTHALLSDTESSAPQKVAEQDTVSAAPQAAVPDRAGDTTTSKAGAGDAGGGGHADPGDSPGSVTAVPGKGDPGKADADNGDPGDADGAGDPGSVSEPTDPAAATPEAPPGAPEQP